MSLVSLLSEHLMWCLLTISFSWNKNEQVFHQKGHMWPRLNHYITLTHNVTHPTHYKGNILAFNLINIMLLTG